MPAARLAWMSALSCVIDSLLGVPNDTAPDVPEDVAEKTHSILYDLLVLASVSGSQLVQYAPATRDGMGTKVEDPLDVGVGDGVGEDAVEDPLELNCTSLPPIAVPLLTIFALPVKFPNWGFRDIKRLPVAAYVAAKTVAPIPAKSSENAVALKGLSCLLGAISAVCLWEWSFFLRASAIIMLILTITPPPVYETYLAKRCSIRPAVGRSAQWGSLRAG